MEFMLTFVPKLIDFEKDAVQSLFTEYPRLVPRQPNGGPKRIRTTSDDLRLLIGRYEYEYNNKERLLLFHVD